MFHLQCRRSIDVINFNFRPFSDVCAGPDCYWPQRDFEWKRFVHKPFPTLIALDNLARRIRQRVRIVIARISQYNWKKNLEGNEINAQP
jgi:hypothetical protein